jgi:hypothetical protein
MGNGTCTLASGDGSVSTPYVVSVVVDPAAVNILECGAGGLLVELETADTTCIDLSGTGTALSPLFATPIIDGVENGNILSCGAAGLVAGGQPFYDFVQALSVAGNVGAINAAAIAYLATL